MSVVQGGGLARLGPSLPLQLSLQIVKEPPVGAPSDDLPGTRLEHSDLVQAEGIEADRGLRVVLAPPVVGNLLHELEREVVAGRVLAVYERARRPVPALAASV